MNLFVAYNGQTHWNWIKLQIKNTKRVGAQKIRVFFYTDRKINEVYTKLHKICFLEILGASSLSLPYIRIT